MKYITNIRKDATLWRAKRRIQSIPDPVLNDICVSLQNHLGCDTSFITFANSQRAFVVGASENFPPEFIKQEGIALNASFCALLINSTSAESGIVANDTKSEPLLKYCPTTAVFGSWVGASIHFRGQIVGAIGVADLLPHEWRKDALSFVKTSASLVEAEIN
jgi:hypothetical protein